jgi:hypothetical protein
VLAGMFAHVAASSNFPRILVDLATANVNL